MNCEEDKSVSTSNSHMSKFKNAGKSFERLRKDRQTNCVELRKTKREEIIEKRRNESNVPTHTEPQPQVQIHNVEQATALVNECNHTDFEVYSKAIFNLRIYLTSDKVKFLDELLKLNVVDILAKRLAPCEQLVVRYNSAWSLTNIASGSSYHTSYLIRDHVVGALVSIFSEPNPTMVEQAIWAISNIVGDGPEARKFVMKFNLLEGLYYVLNNNKTNLKIVDQLSWLLINVCRKKEKEVPLEYLPKILPLISSLFDITDETVIGNAIWSITHISDSSSEHIKMLVESGLVNRVLPYLQSSHKLTVSSIRAIGNIAASTDDMTQYLLEHGLYKNLAPILECRDSKIKKEVYWLLSNIAAGTRDHMLSLYSLKIFPQILADLEYAEYSVQKEACWIISNVLHTCTIAEAQVFIDNRVLQSFAKFMKGSDTAMIIVVLEVYLILLRLYTAENRMDYICDRIEETGVLEYIEALQHHKNEAIYHFVSLILQQYFAEDDYSVANEESMNLGGTTSTQQINTSKSTTTTTTQANYSEETDIQFDF